MRSGTRRPTAPPRPLEPEIRTWLEPSRWRLPAVLGKWALDPAYRQLPDEITVTAPAPTGDNRTAWILPPWLNAWLKPALQAGRLGSQYQVGKGGQPPVDVFPPAQNPAPIIRPLGPVKPPGIPGKRIIWPKGVGPGQYFYPYRMEPIA